MRKITDLRGIKDTAKVFLHMNIEETKFSPLVIKHPFTDSAMVCLSQTDGEIAFASQESNEENDQSDDYEMKL